MPRGSRGSRPRSRRPTADLRLRSRPMERRGIRAQSVAMFRPAAVLALAVVPTLAAASDLDAAMRCVAGTMTSALVPATASAEQLANVAIARCADEIELAAIALAGNTLVHARIDASRA